MKEIMFFKDKLIIDVPDYYSYTSNEYYTLVLYTTEGKKYAIKFIVIDSNENDKHKELYNEIVKRKNVYKAYSDEKYFSVFNHSFDLENGKLYITSFEIIFKNYYINIRWNELEEMDVENKIGFIEYIEKLISTIKEN